jgi:hypothetical protein
VLPLSLRSSSASLTHAPRAPLAILLAGLHALTLPACDEHQSGRGHAPHEDAGAPEGSFRCPTFEKEEPDPTLHPPSAWCDGVLDCASGIDEERCPERKQVVCRDELAVPSPPTPPTLGPPELIDEARLCDGVVDCKTRPPADEQRCAEFFLCIADGAWISLPRAKVCDGVIDCSIDERDCPDAAHFRCASGGTIPAVNVCDARQHCSDGSDEYSTQCPGQIPCPGPKLRTSEPISYYLERQHCDGHADCPGSSDEAKCGSYVHCTNDLLLPRTRVCDGTPDCPDGRDEQGCQ